MLTSPARRTRTRTAALSALAVLASATVTAAAAPAATADSHHLAYRGWIHVAEEYKESWFGDNTGRHFSQNTYVDVSPTSSDGSWTGDGLYQFQAAPDFCQTLDAKFAGGGEATGAVVYNESTDILTHALPVGTRMLSWGFQPLNATMPGTGKRTFCGAPADEIPYSESAIGTYYGGVPLNPDGSDPATAARAYSFEAAHVVIDVTVCMTSSTTDTDGDGLPDGVDLAPTTYGSAEDLGGAPGAGDDTPPCSLIANQPPNAEPDQGATSVNTAVDIPVTANDSDPDGDPISLASCTAPMAGSVTVSGNVARYTPPRRFKGQVDFTCTVRDPGGLTDTAAVSVVVGAKLTVTTSIDFMTYWYNAVPNFSLKGSPGSDRVIVEGVTTSTVSGDAAGVALVSHVCITPGFKAFVTRNVGTVPVFWTEGGRNLMGEDDYFWATPIQQSDGGLASNLIAKAPVCGPPGSAGATYAPAGDIVGDTWQPGETNNFAGVTHTATVTVTLVTGATASFTCAEAESAAKRPPAGTDLDEVCTGTIQL